MESQACSSSHSSTLFNIYNSVSSQTSLVVKHKYGTTAGGCSTKSLLSSFRNIRVFNM
ncbi:hypothetical protein Nmel_008104 [Mimus melanotis]